jgi:hypothetical protein
MRWWMRREARVKWRLDDREIASVVLALTCGLPPPTGRSVRAKCEISSRKAIYEDLVKLSMARPVVYHMSPP